MTRCIPHNAQYTQLQFSSRFISIEIYTKEREKPVYSLFGIVLFPFIHSFFLLSVCVFVFLCNFWIDKSNFISHFFQRFVFKLELSFFFFMFLLWFDNQKFVVLTILTKRCFTSGENMKSFSSALVPAWLIQSFERFWFWGHHQPNFLGTFRWIHWNRKKLDYFKLTWVSEMSRSISMNSIRWCEKFGTVLPKRKWKAFWLQMLSWCFRVVVWRLCVCLCLRNMFLFICDRFCSVTDGSCNFRRFSRAAALSACCPDDSIIIIIVIFYPLHFAIFIFIFQNLFDGS